jgi:hypothetical protein
MPRDREVPRGAGLTHTTTGWRHCADSTINARWSVRRKPATAGSTTADPARTDLRDGWSGLYRPFDVTFNRAVLEFVSQYLRSGMSLGCRGS